jgi:hypothetical protein
MRKLFAAAAAASLVWLGTSAFVAPAQARPPNFLFSPGYQARLAESRKAYAESWSLQQIQQPVAAHPRKPKHHTRQ